MFLFYIFERYDKPRLLPDKENKEYKRTQKKENNDKSNAKRRVPDDERVRRNLSGLSVEEKKEEHNHMKRCHEVETADKRKEQADERKKHKRVKFYEERLDKKNKKKETFGLCSTLYISDSEIFHQYDEYDVETDKNRLRELYDDEDEVDQYQRVNEFTQVRDFGGWRTKKDCKTPAVQKWHKEMDGDYYICPYCTAYLLVDECETKTGYNYPCCHKGTMRTLIELEKARPQSLFKRYIINFFITHVRCVSLVIQVPCFN